MRVLLVLASSDGGIGRHVAGLAGGLVSAGVRVVVAGPSEAAGRFGFESAGARFAPVEIADRPRPAADARALLRLRRLAGDADVVHAHGLRAGALAVLASRLRGREAVVVTLHNALLAATGRTAAVHRLLERVVARGAAVVLVVSSDLGDAVRARGARDVRRALVPAADAGPARPAAAVRSALGVPQGTALLLTVARLAPQKGLETLLEAIRLLAPGPPAVRAVVAGEGPLAARLSARSRGLPVSWLGRRDDVPDLLGAADVVVVPSVWEGQPMIVSEALRAGAPVVATDAGGTAELAGGAARLVPPGDPAALAGAVAELLLDPAGLAEWRRRSAERGRQLPSAADATRQVLEIYREVTSAARPRRSTTPS